MFEQTTIEVLATDADTAAVEEFVVDWLPGDEADGLPAVIEEHGSAFPVFFPTMARPTAAPPVGPRSIRLAIIAAAISLVVHVGLAGAVHWVIHAGHTFVAAHPQTVQGDGAMVLGAIDHDGNDQAPGATGLGSLTPGWSAPSRSGETPALDDPSTLDASDTPSPTSAPPPPPPEASDTNPAPDPVAAADVTIDPLQPDRLPVFPHHLPARAQAAPVPATAPADQAIVETQPTRAAVELASTRPAGPPTAPSPPAVAAAKRPVGSDAAAMAAGFSTSASEKTGGLMQHAGPGGSNGKGGAVTGDGGTAVSGRPGTPAGVKGRPLHADYPDDCKRRGETGRVVIEVDVRADGTIASSKVLTDGGHPHLGEAALDAFRGRTFFPALLDGRPVRSTLKYPFVFELR
jgi:protein TonB